MLAATLPLVRWRSVSPFALVSLSALVGFVGWRGIMPAMAVLPVFVWSWSRACNRREAFAIALAYYLIASRCLLQVGANFWGADALSALRGFGVWIPPGVLLAACWAYSWGGRYRGLRVLLALLITTVPPVGIIGWASPLSSAGALFPGCGWIGLVLTLGLLSAVCMEHRMGLAMLVIVSLLCNLFMPESKSLPANWIGLQTHYGNPSAPGTEFDRIMDMRSAVARLLRQAPAGSVIVFPESLVGEWDVADVQFDRLAELARHKQSTVLFGALSQQTGQPLINGMFEPGRSAPTANSRIAIPLGLWRPWSDVSTKVSLLDAGIVHIQERHVAFLICFEQLVNWPILMSLAAQPDLIVAPANIWFGDGGSLEGIQHQNAGSWARLFDLPVLFVANHQSQR